MAVIDVEATVCEILTVYVPVPPVPVPNAVIIVPAVAPVPDIWEPTCRTPEVTAVTVSVVVEMEPVTTAPVVGPEMMLLLMMLLSLPVEVPVLKKMTPEATEVPAPRIAQLVTVFDDASPRKRIVLEVVPGEKFVMVKVFPLAFRPSIVTLSAPFRSISGLPPAIVPLILRAPDGVIEMLA